MSAAIPEMPASAAIEGPPLAAPPPINTLPNSNTATTATTATPAPAPAPAPVPAPEKTNTPPAGLGVGMQPPNSNSGAAKEGGDPEKNPYFYTQREFWGGATLSYPIFAFLSIAFGLLGVDHLYLRSPTTAFFKVLVNVLTLGFWWFYDISQIVMESDSVKKYGLAMPFKGPTGIAAGSFLEKGETNTNASPLMFLAYAIATIALPYGIDYFIAGDIKGGIAKALASLMWFGLIYGAVNIYKLIVTPEKVLCEGTSRYAPFTVPFIGLKTRYMEASFMNTKKGACPPYDGEFGFSSLLGFIKKIPIVGALLGAAQTAAAAAAIAGTDVALGLATDAASMVDLSSMIPGGKALGAAADKAEAAVPGVQKGGGGGGGQSEASAQKENTIVGFTLALVFIGAAFLKGKDIIATLVQRNSERPPAVGSVLWRKQNVDDLPPTPPESGVF